MNQAPYPVGDSADLQRILALPEREYDEAAARVLAEQITPYFLNPRGLAAWNYLATLPFEVREAALADTKGPYAGRTPLRLQPEQAFMAHDFGWVGGLWASAPLGIGKTLTIYLLILIAVERFGCRRPLVVCPGDLLHEMRTRFAAYATYFRAIPVPVMFESFESLWGPDSTHRLCRCSKCITDERADEGGLRPDCMFTDEADRERRPDNKTRKRKARFFARHPIPCAFLTATPMRHSHKDFAHLMIWALKLRAPVCLKPNERDEWAQALDTKLRARRRPVGKLGMIFGGLSRDEANWRDLGYDAKENPDVGGPRGERLVEERRKKTLEGLSRRWQRTPGVCVFNRPSCTTPIIIRPIPAPPDTVVDEAFAYFRQFDETPTGDQVTDSLSQHNLSTQMGAGLHHVLVPAPDQEFKKARKAAAMFVRDVMSSTSRWNSRDPIDSEANVYRRHPTEPCLVKWRKLKDATKRTSVPKPFSVSVVNAAAQWLRANSPCLVWVLNSWVGEAIARTAGVQYFSNGGKAKGGMRIENLGGQNSAVVSCHSNRRGRDLYAWNRMLYVGWEQSGDRIEQLIGRPHRQGQLESVFIDVMVLSGETLYAMQEALREVAGVDDHIPVPSKLKAATWDWSYIPDDFADWRTYHPGAGHPPDDSPGWRWIHQKLNVRALKATTQKPTHSNTALLMTG